MSQYIIFSSECVLSVRHTAHLKTQINIQRQSINPLKGELNPICHFLALLGAHHILHVSRIRVNTKFVLYTKVYMSRRHVST